MIDSCSLEASAGAVGSAVAKLRSKATSERRRKAIGAERYRDGCRDAQPHTARLALCQNPAR